MFISFHLFFILSVLPSLGLIFVYPFPSYLFFLTFSCVLFVIPLFVSYLLLFSYLFLLAFLFSGLLIHVSSAFSLYLYLFYFFHVFLFSSFPHTSYLSLSILPLFCPLSSVPSSRNMDKQRDTHSPSAARLQS